MSHYQCQACSADMPVLPHDEDGCESDGNGLCIHIAKAESEGWLDVRVVITTRLVDRKRGDLQEPKTLFIGSGWLCPTCAEQYNPKQTTTKGGE